MNNFWNLLLAWLLYAIAGGLGIGHAVDKWNKKHYIRFGFHLMVVISAVILMAKLCLMY